MEKNYCLKVNEHSLFFKSLDSVVKWFKKSGVEKRLELEDEEYVDLDNLESIVGDEEVEIYNDCMCERGDDYCSISLEEITFED
jgi:hypothetical protein